MPHTVGGGGGGGGYEEVAAARRGRFRVTSSSTPQGPPETTLGRFRLMPTSNYGTISPILQRGRFAVIPEEPHGSPAQGTPPAERSLRSPSPEWDFDIEQVAKIKTIIRPGGLEKNFDRLLHTDVYLATNYDGVNGKRGLREFKALHEAIFEAVKEEGVTYDTFKKQIQQCFKSYKNRFYAKKCRDSKKPNK